MNRCKNWSQRLPVSAGNERLKGEHFNQMPVDQVVFQSTSGVKFAELPTFSAEN